MIQVKVMKHMVNMLRPLIYKGSLYMINFFKVTSALNFHPIEREKILICLHMMKF